MKTIVIALAAVGSLALASPAAATGSTSGCPAWRCGFNGVELNGLELNGPARQGLAGGLASSSSAAKIEYTCPTWRCGFNGLELNGVNFNGPLIQGVQLQGWTLNGVNFNGPQLQGPVLNGLAQGRNAAVERPGVRAIVLPDGRRVVVQ